MIGAPCSFYIVHSLTFDDVGKFDFLNGWTCQFVPGSLKDGTFLLQKSEDILNGPYSMRSAFIETLPKGRRPGLIAAVSEIIYSIYVSDGKSRVHSQAYVHPFKTLTLLDTESNRLETDDGGNLLSPYDISELVDGAVRLKGIRAIQFIS